MDSRATLHDQLFSRNSTPPATQQYPATQHMAHTSSSSLIDSLFQNISAPSTEVHPPQQPAQQPQPGLSAISDPVDGLDPSAIALVGEPENPSSQSTSPAATDRANALLSLLGGPAPSAARPPLPLPPPPQQQQQQQQPQLHQLQQQQQHAPVHQIPTPPAPSQRTNASPPHTETQKNLLEQLMSGGTIRSSTFSDSQRSNISQPAAPSPPYSQQREDYTSYTSHSNEASPRTQPIPHTHLSQQTQQQAQPPSPRRSMFEFMSPFDHLSGTGSIKKKPPPPPSGLSAASDESNWTTVDPRRQSVENLLENLTRPAPHQVPLPQPQAPAYEAYLAGDFSQSDSSSSRAPLPPIPKPVPGRTSSPRGSPPKPQTLHRPQPRAAETLSQPIQQQTNQAPATSRREKESSPDPRGNGRNKSTAVPTKFGSKSQSSPSPQSQSIIFDVSQHLDEIQAPRDAVKSTAIALVKQDPVFLPGTTIGATHWVAYSMTRGRVRVISRSSGDRTLLQLPSVFPPSSMVIDMAVYGNRLAGVTSDGGFVVWELPELITDDVPGRLLLCVPPISDSDALRAVKWHPKDPDMLAVASDNKVYVLDLVNTHALHGQPLPHSNLHHLGHLFTVPSPVVGFDFDVVRFSLATISEDSSLTIWNMQDHVPIAVHKVRGEDVPSSLTFVDGGIVVGRKNGTIFQLLSMTTKSVLSTIKFVNGAQEDPDMFGHISYDSRIQTLWVANSRRDSLIALKIHLEPTFAGGEESVRGYIEQVAEFSGLKPTIHFVILTADADPHGDEAQAACIAAKIPPGDLALVAFSVHSSGVDQVLIRKEWFDHALSSAESKYPVFDLPQQPNPLPAAETNKPQRAPLPVVPSAPQPQPAMAPFVPPPASRARTPTSEDLENDYNDGSKGKGGKGKNVNWKKEDEPSKEKEKAKPNPADASALSDSALAQTLAREIKKSEENLHGRIGRLINKELDKQHQRLEEARLHDQAEDFARQEKILKLISTELTRNTTRVVEMAVKTEVQNSVLPSLENVTRTEVKAAIQEHLGVGLSDALNRSLPTEMEKLLLRPTISNHFANILSSTMTPLIERQIKETLTTTFFQINSQTTAAMHQELSREFRSEVNNLKSEFARWHSESLRSQESTIRDLEHTVRALADQVKFLTIGAQPSAIHHPPVSQPSQSSPASQPTVPAQATHLRQAPVQSAPAAAPSYVPHHNHGYQQQAPPPPPPPPQPTTMHPQWFNIAAPQASHPATLLQQQQQQQPVSVPAPERTPPAKTEDWDDVYLGVLHTQDSLKLRDLLSRTNPDHVFSINGTPLVSQAVILTLVHRLSAIVGDTSPNDDIFKTSLWWLQRVAIVLRPEDKLISDFIPRVIPTVTQSLNTTKQRLAILPGSATLETARSLSDVQETLRRKISS